MKISVVIPFYQRQHCFQATLQSVLKQSYPVEEIIVVDDNSGGDANEFLGQFEDYINIITLPKNVGAAQARNIGVAAAKGDMIAFLDSDDRWHPEKLKKQVRYLERNPGIKVLHTGCRSVYPDGRYDTYIDKSSPLTFHDQLLENQFKIQSALIDRKYFLELGGFTSHMRNCQDYELAMKIISRGGKIAFLSEALTDIHQGHSDKLSNRSWAVFKGQFKVIWIYRKSFISNVGIRGTCTCLFKRLERFGFAKGGALGFLSRKLAQTFLQLWPVDRLIEAEQQHSASGHLQ